jgi:5-aminolevulinate synthase
VIKIMETIVNQCKKACPFLHKSTTASLRKLSRMPAPAGFTSESGYVRANALTIMAQKCPVMGKAMAVQSKNYLHTSARLAKQPTLPLKQASLVNNENEAHVAAAAMLNQFPTIHSTHSKPFDYEALYNSELEKKHQDKSYRYFNNINRLAKQFPRAHTANLQEEVTVWCSNDYLGMGRNPLVLDAMQ